MKQPPDAVIGALCWRLHQQYPDAQVESYRPSINPTNTVIDVVGPSIWAGFSVTDREIAEAPSLDSIWSEMFWGWDLP